MEPFDQIARGGHEQVVLCHEPRERAARDHRDPRHDARAGARRDPPVALRERRRGAARRAAAVARDDLQGGRLRPRPGRRQDGRDRRARRRRRVQFRALGRYIDTLGGRYIGAEDVGTSPREMDWISRETPWVTGVPGDWAARATPRPDRDRRVRGHARSLREAFGARPGRAARRRAGRRPRRRAARADCCCAAGARVEWPTCTRSAPRR